MTALPLPVPGAIPVQAGDLRAPPILIQPIVSLFEGFTDNALSTPKKSPDGVTRLFGGTTVSADTVRLQGVMTGSLNYQKFVHNTSQDSLNANLAAYGLGTVVRDHLFVDARAAMTQVSQTGGLGFASPTLIRQSNQTQVFTTSISPFVRESFGGYADGELRYRYGAVLSQQGSLLGSSNTVPNSINLNNATSNEATAILTTGPLFTLFGSRSTLDWTKIDSQSAARSTQLTGYDDLVYQFNPKFAGLGRIGYENLDYPLQPGASFNGAAWSVGGQYTPFPGSYFIGNYGRQEGLLGFTGALRYQATPLTALLASVTRNRASQQQQILSNLNASGVNAAGNVVDQYTGLPLAFVNPQLSLNNAVYKYETARAGLQTQIDRNGFGLFGIFEKRTPLGTPIGTAATATPPVANTSEGVNLSWFRSLTPRLNSNATLGYAVATSPSEKTLTATFSMTYLLGEKLNAILNYQFINVDSSGVGTSYQRNQVEIGLTRSF